MMRSSGSENLALLFGLGSIAGLVEEGSCLDLLVEFCGSTYFAPTSLLQQLAALPAATFISPPFTYSPHLAHDLESLVKVCFAA